MELEVDTRWYTNLDDLVNITLVNAHPKGTSAHHNLVIFINKDKCMGVPLLGLLELDYFARSLDKG